MRNVIPLIALLSISFLLKSQVKIPEGNFSFLFPNKDWKYFTTTNSDSCTVYTFAYSNETTTDSTSPILRIYIEPNSKYESGVEFSLYHFLKYPFNVIDYFSEDSRLPNKDAIGYTGSYTDSQSMLYKLLIIDFLHKKHGIEFKFMVKEDIYPLFEKQFDSILQSIVLE